MMDVSGTDPRTRTGLFLWPWASYPAVAANAAVGNHAQPIMMGAAAAANAMSAVSGSGMLGVSHQITGSSTPMSGNMIDDPFGSFCQRFSYPTAQAAAHMSHILPHHHLASREQHDSATNDANHPSHSPHSIAHTRAHINSSTQRLLSPQSRAIHLHQHNSSATNTTPHNDQLMNDSTNNHAAAIAAFASVAASSGIIGANDSHNNITNGTDNNLALQHGIQMSRHMQQGLRSEALLDTRCNGLIKSNQFCHQLQSSLNSRHPLEHSTSLSPRQVNSVLCINGTNHTVNNNNNNCHSLKDLHNSAAAAALAAAVGEHVQFRNDDNNSSSSSSSNNNNNNNNNNHHHHHHHLLQADELTDNSRSNGKRISATLTSSSSVSVAVVSTNGGHTTVSTSSTPSSANAAAAVVVVAPTSGASDNYTISQRQQHYLFSPKSSLSDSMDNPSTNDSNIDLTSTKPINTNNNTSNGNTNSNSTNHHHHHHQHHHHHSDNQIPGDRIRSGNNLIYRNSSTSNRDASPESTTPCNDDSVVNSHDDAKVNSSTANNKSNNNNTNSNNNNSNSLRLESRFLGITTEDSLSLAGLCNGDGSLSSLVSIPNGHASSYHPPAKGYKCKICQHVCFSRHDLSAHNAATHKQDPRPYRCEQCGRQFSTCAYLSQHRRIHTGVKPYACRYCDRRFTQLSHVQQHERIHTGEKPYRCNTCMKSFTQMSNLQSHQRQHMKGKPFRCEQCFMSFDVKDELDVHVQAKHSGNRYAKVSKKILVCPICTKSYNSETYLAKHVDRHKEAAANGVNPNNASNGNSNNNNNNNSNNNSNSNSNSNNNNNNNNNINGNNNTNTSITTTNNNTNGNAIASGGANVGSSNDISLSHQILRNNCIPSVASVAALGGPTCADNLFAAANFHNHPVAMAAAALSRGGGGVPGGVPASLMDPSVHSRHLAQGLHTTSHSQQEAATACAAAVAAAQVHHDLHMRAVAAAAAASSSNGVSRADLEQSCALFNSTTANCALGASTLCEPRC